MKRWRERILPISVGMLVFLGLLMNGCTQSERRPNGEMGLVVEWLDPSGDFAKAGVQTGDRVIRGWRPAKEPEGRSGMWHFSDPVAFYILERSEAVLAPMVLELLRPNGESYQITVKDHYWGVIVRGALDGAILSDYLAGTKHFAADQLPQAFKRWQVAAETMTAQNPRSAMWIWTNLALYQKQSDLVQMAQSLGKAVNLAVVSEAGPEELIWLNDLIVWCVYLDTDVSRPILADTIRLLHVQVPDSPLLAQTFLLSAFVESVITVDGSASEPNLAKAIASLGKSIDILNRRAPNSHQLAKAFYYRGTFYYDYHKLPQAISDFKAALVILESSFADDNRSIVRNLYELARTYRLQGDFHSAEALAKRVIKRSDPNLPKLKTDSLILLGNVYNLRRDFHKALDRYGEAHLLATTTQQKLMIANAMGVVYKQQNNIALAEEKFREVQTLAGDQEDYRETVRLALTNLAEVYLKKRNKQPEALQILREAVDVLPLKSHPELIDAWLLKVRGEANRELKDWDKARADLVESQRLYDELENNEFGRALARYEMARLAMDQGNQDLAVNDLLTALDLLEKQLSIVGGSEAIQAEFHAQFDSIYKSLVEVHIRTGDFSKAYAWNERGRAQVFLRNLYQRDFIEAGKVPAETTRRLHAIRKELKRFEDLAHVGSTKEQAAAAAQKSMLTEELDSILTERERHVHTFSELKTMKPWGVEDTQALLDEGTLLLSFSVHEDFTEIFVIGKDIFTAERVELGERLLRSRIENLNGFFALVRDGDGLDRVNWRRADSFYLESYDLFCQLIRPIMPYIERSDRLVISPDGPLHLLPFAVLVTSEPARWDEQANPTFLNQIKPLHHTISMPVYAKSIQERDVSKSSSSAFVVSGFGNPRPPKSEDAGPTFGDLPYAEFEVEALYNLDPDAPLIFLGEKATEAAVKKLNGRFDIVHFAAHIQLDKHNPLSTSLVLTPGDGEDGFLSSAELLSGLKFQPDLLILSACNSAAGRDLAGEGLLSFARAFHYNQVRSMVASSWQVADYASAAFMHLFYYFIKDGLDFDRALQSVQSYFMNLDNHGNPDWQHPFYWAGFRLTGDWQAKGGPDGAKNQPR